MGLFQAGAKHTHRGWRAWELHYWLLITDTDWPAGGEAVKQAVRIPGCMMRARSMLYCLGQGV